MSATTSTLAVDKSFSATTTNIPLSTYTTEQQKLLLSLRDYCFSYEAFLDEPETKQALLQFMKIIHCEESIMFLDQVNEYYRKRSAANKWNALQQIFITFFSGNSVHELNLPQRSREVMEQSFMDLNDKITLKTPTNSSNASNSTLQQVNIDSSDLQECEEALKKAESYILVNMKEHVFPMFLESDTFKQFVCKKSKQFLNQIGTVRNLSHSCFVESLMDMKSCEITVDQIKMIKQHVLEEKFWDCIYSKDTCFAFLSSNKYILGEEESKKGIYFAKSQVIFPYTVEQMMNIMTNTTIRLASDKNLDSIKIVGYLNKSGGDLLSSPPKKYKSSESLSSLNHSPPASPHSTHSNHSASSDSLLSLNKLSGKTRLATVLTHEVYKLVWPVKNRYYVLAQSMVYDTTDKLYIVAKKSCEPPNYKLSEKDAIKALDIGAWIFMPVMVDGKEHCKYIELIGTDLRGSLPNFIVHKIVKTRAKNFFRETMKVIKQTKCDMYTRPANSSGYFETLDENGSIAL
ncbi:predicted protein [Naegleria gruberi]|uniref:Predicted protein n=1 Tax=Naegleria gruberi TaxID=5762 RepID=D2VQP5_NAEGR|nr:uncharacterized protein NAEGRDRAFT_71300 [Naegleria gruberi]EFC40984.1 predicted protein [Naegleria gruberi]|eukprot:XP_002673728.1 predicted protein [Naegleria gruberi strain NEG-M]